MNLLSSVIRAPFTHYDFLDTKKLFDVESELPSPLKLNNDTIEIECDGVNGTIKRSEWLNTTDTNIKQLEKNNELVSRPPTPTQQNSESKKLLSTMTSSTQSDSSISSMFGSLWGNNTTIEGKNIREVIKVDVKKYELNEKHYESVLFRRSAGFMEIKYIIIQHGRYLDSVITYYADNHKGNGKVETYKLHNKPIDIAGFWKLTNTERLNISQFRIMYEIHNNLSMCVSKGYFLNNVPHKYNDVTAVNYTHVNGKYYIQKISRFVNGKLHSEELPAVKYFKVFDGINYISKDVWMTHGKFNKKITPGAVEYELIGEKAMTVKEIYFTDNTTSHPEYDAGNTYYLGNAVDKIINYEILNGKSVRLD